MDISTQSHSSWVLSSRACTAIELPWLDPRSGGLASRSTLLITPEFLLTLSTTQYENNVGSELNIWWDLLVWTPQQPCKVLAPPSWVEWAAYIASGLFGQHPLYAGSEPPDQVLAVVHAQRLEEVLGWVQARDPGLLEVVKHQLTRFYVDV